MLIPNFNLHPLYLVHTQVRLLQQSMLHKLCPVLPHEKLSQGHQGKVSLCALQNKVRNFGRKGGTSEG